MKKVIILIGGYVFLGITIAMMQSCFLSYDDWITDIVFKGGNYPPNKNTDVDDLTKKIDFYVIAGSSQVNRFAGIKNIDLFSKCYAITKSAKWQNSLDISSFSMTFDRSFVFESDTIRAGIDILKLGRMISHISIDKNKEEPDSFVVFYQINFSPELKNQLTFESGEYEVNFSCRTTDEKEFSKSRRVIFCED